MSLRSEPVVLPTRLMCRHAAILGTSGSGKTTTALTMIEQLLERGVPAILVDRKGDFAGYARPNWWQRSGDDAGSARKNALAQAMDVRLFTPGTRGQGRPLSLPAVPDVAGLQEHDRDLAVRHAAGALAHMAGIKGSGNGQRLQAILAKAIDLLSRQGRGADIEQLLDFIDERDDSLVAAVPRFDDKLFRKLVQDLEAVRVNNGDLFDRGVEPLTAETLLDPAADGRVALSIVSTRFLGDSARVQIWVARLLGELARFAARKPSKALQAVVLFDEADIYLPVGTVKPPTKEPMWELLRRARSGGLGVLLATQSPADFDYRARDLVTTWLVGKVGDRRSIEKMRPLFEGRRGVVEGKLPRLGPGQFFIMGSGDGVREVKVDRSLLDTEQLPTDEILALASR